MNDVLCAFAAEIGLVISDAAYAANLARGAHGKYWAVAVVPHFICPSTTQQVVGAQPPHAARAPHCCSAHTRGSWRSRGRCSTQCPPAPLLACSGASRPPASARLAVRAARPLHQLPSLSTAASSFFTPPGCKLPPPPCRAASPTSCRPTCWTSSSNSWTRSAAAISTHTPHGEPPPPRAQHDILAIRPPWEARRRASSRARAER